MDMHLGCKKFNDPTRNKIHPGSWKHRWPKYNWKNNIAEAKKQIWINEEDCLD